MDELEVSRPHAYRLLKRARQELGDIDGKRNALTNG